MSIPDEKDNTNENYHSRRDGKSWVQRNLLTIALLLFAAVPIAFFVMVILRSEITIGAPATEQEALIRANERLLQMTQWTIGTVLTLGVALIGFNWIVASRNHDRDREALRDHQETLSRYSDIALERQKDLVAGLIEQVNFNRAETREQLDKIRDDVSTVRTNIDRGEIQEERTRLSLGFLLVERWEERLRQRVERRDTAELLVLELRTALYDFGIFNHEETTKEFLKRLMPIIEVANGTDLKKFPMTTERFEHTLSTIKQITAFIAKSNPEGSEELISLVNRLERQITLPASGSPEAQP